jgi:glycosyltransferase involved in cell wall biosynthesis
MACGLPVVASPVGVNQSIVEHGMNGFLASTMDEWIDALIKLRSSIDLRLKMGIAGRKKVESYYSLEKNANQLVIIFDKIVAEGALISHRYSS